ncbi:MAG: zinc-binding alcohol dehydrogenase family protein, partial [Cytophagaceae bacterium]
MKAAILYSPGDLPQYADVAEPLVQNADELLLTVTAAALKNLDRSQAKGTHYATNSAADAQPPARLIGGAVGGVMRAFGLAAVQGFE